MNVLDLLVPDAGAFYVMDRGFIDFKRLSRMDAAGAFLVTRAKSNLRFKRLVARPVDKTTGLICDHSVALTVFRSKQGYAKALPRIRYRDPDTGKRVVFLTNHFDLPALTICQLYRLRWQVELFFKWIKQHLRIKILYGTSENAVKTQIWIAMCVYVLVAIVRKRLKLEASMHALLQILSLALFEHTPLDQLLRLATPSPGPLDEHHQMNLFE